MHGSPCQDFSIAGNNEGGDEGSGTRSSLMYETLRIVTKLRPKYVIWENVKNLLSPKHRHNFDEYLNRMFFLGYNSYYQVMNAKDYGIPQNRERVFTVSILKEYDENGYEFPNKKQLDCKLKDLLEDNVDEKYYLSDKMINCFMSDGTGKYPRRERFESNINRKNQDVANSITTKAGTRATDNFVINNKRLEETLKINNDKLMENSYIDSYNKKVNNSGIIGTITTRVSASSETHIIKNQRIRKLTPKECWRLMGFEDQDIDKASKVNSDTQLYKQAGNSIVVNVLEEIIKNLRK